MRLQQEIFREYLGAILARLMKGHSAASLGRWLWVTVSSTLWTSVLYIQGRSASGDAKIYDKAVIGREERLEELKAEC